MALLSNREVVLASYIAWWRSPAAVAWGQWTAWSVWSGLRAQLGEVHVRSSTVADSHRLSELALGVETVEDYTIDSQCEDLDHDFDDAADE